MAEKQAHADVAADKGALEASSSHEKHVADDGAKRTERIHEFHEAEGYIIDITADDAIKTSALKLAKDGRTVLIPQPSDDKNDPLNWSWARKHLILFVVAFVSFLPDYGSATGAVTLIPQAA
jgi:hypothetical protein